MKIIVDDDYMVSAINDGNLNKNKDAFSRFQFNALRFDVVNAEKKSSEAVSSTELEEIALCFVQELQRQGVKARYNGLIDRYIRITLQPRGTFDIYNTPKRPPSNPRARDFIDSSLQQQVETLWRDFLINHKKKTLPLMVMRKPIPLKSILMDSVTNLSLLNVNVLI